MAAASFGGFGDFAIDAPGTGAGRFVVKDTTGNVGINNPNPTGATLEVVARSTTLPAILASGGNTNSTAPAILAFGANTNSTANAPDGIDAGGGNNNGAGNGGNGANFVGGNANGSGGNGGSGATFVGGFGCFPCGIDGDGIDATQCCNFVGNYAGNFTGDINVTGAVFAHTKDFKIDHPLDPANKYLFHASVESSEMKNIYDGIVILDASGDAVVELPGWFEALNTDFRYQLTAIGQPSPGLYIAREISGGSFQIAGGLPGTKVSWQVTGVRQDPYAKAHPLIVEQEKEDRLKGFYIQPELYGQPEEKQIEWARHPQMMKQIKEMRARQLAASQRQTVPRN